MPITLFQHNAEAYYAVVEMLTETGKAAVIHPTGTGKSFIGFKLCETYADKSICWLSPSEYIFQTQIENLKAVSFGYVPENIKFYTYAKLMNMSDAALAEIQPDYMVLDEFHRAGAAQWGQGIQRLLNVYPDVPLLGMSATAVRYLDNQRDMSDELFDGNIASEMTLGEAIVRGILNPPKYVLSVFSYQKDLKKYEKRIKKAKNKAVRDTAEQCLEALRRALEQADGLDVIFDKHMTDRHGKYIVFCADYEHLCAMTEKANEWFARVDTTPHIYTAYADDPKTSHAFAAFKADNSDHLKLLYCIDMLNEGIHVDDVSGVILLRPTVSPIIYKQQIGRALAAGKKNNAVIFDIVLNIENLYSIGAVEEEMRMAMTYYHFHDQEDAIVNEHFQIIDEVHDCRALFVQLDDALTASWDIMYRCAKEYFMEHGNLEIPKRYKTAEGYSLGQWIHTQRKVRAGVQYGVLGEDRIARLDEIGMCWEDHSTVAWSRYYAALCSYKKTYGDLDIKAQYVTDDGLDLGAFVSNLRNSRSAGKRSSYLTEARVGTLDALGFIWDKQDFLWEKNYLACARFYDEHGHLDVPVGYISDDGLRIGNWIRNIRGMAEGNLHRTMLTEQQREMLDAIGMRWEGKISRRWEQSIKELCKFKEAHGTLDVPADYVSDTGFHLGAFLSDQRSQYRSGKLSEKRQKALLALGVTLDREDPFEIRFALLEQFYNKNGHIRVPAKYIVDGIWLNKWVNELKHIYRGERKGKRLTEEQIKRLEQIGMCWSGRMDRNVQTDTYVKNYSATHEV